MQDNVMALLREAGVRITFDKRGYRPALSLEGVETKILKPQNIVEMLHSGSRDLGFAGADWVAEKQARLEPLLDCELDPVRIVAAAEPSFLRDGKPRPGLFRVATEYQRLTQNWLDRCGYEGQIVRAYGATEVFPPEDADCITDNTATGATLKANGLHIFDVLMRSSTFLYAHPAALDNPAKRERIEHFKLLVQSVLDARKRVMLEVNVGAADLEKLVAVLPCMREPTVSPLHGQGGFAVKAAVPRHDLPQLIKSIKSHGGSDIVVSGIAQIVP